MRVVIRTEGWTVNVVCKCGNHITLNDQLDAKCPFCGVPLILVLHCFCDEHGR